MDLIRFLSEKHDAADRGRGRLEYCLVGAAAVAWLAAGMSFVAMRIAPIFSAIVAALVHTTAR